jgi:hypothetical protein
MFVEVCLLFALSALWVVVAQFALLIGWTPMQVGKEKSCFFPIGQPVTTATEPAGGEEVFEDQVLAASWSATHGKEAQTRIFSSPLPNRTTRPGVCICIPGALFWVCIFSTSAALLRTPGRHGRSQMALLHCGGA